MKTRFKNAFRKGFRKPFSRPDAAERQIVAEHHEMTTVLHRLKPASLDLSQEGVTTGKTLDIADLSFDHSSLAGFGRGKHLFNPGFGGQMIRDLYHEGSLANRG
ncbi:hypothetical protein RXV86_01325 [Alisedimentitalea sp. MJ-SS2]|nr:hypothetical protein [Alisedimentitalea sp. MJ-SS2]